MKKWKVFSAMLALLLTVVLVVGCGGGNNAADPKQGSGQSQDQGSTTTPSTSNQPDTTNNNTPAPSDEPKPLQGKLVIWTFAGQVEDMAKKFMEKHPGVTVELTVFPGDQYQTKLMAAMQSGVEAPDIFDLERGYIGKFIEAPFVADLTALGGEELVENYIPYVEAMGRDKNGTLRAISDHSSPGGFWYLKESAKKWLGTDDPNEVAAMVDSWEKVYELGKKVYAESNGTAYLIHNYSMMYDVEVYNMQPFVQDGKLVIDPAWQGLYGLMNKIRNENVDAKLGFLSAGWNTALNDGSVILHGVPAWATSNIDNKDGKAENKYAVAKTPKGWYKGGTYRALYEKSPNKELALEFLKYIASPEWQKYNLEATGNMPGNSVVFEENMDTSKTPFTGDQKVLEVYYDLLKAVPAVAPDQYNEEVFKKFKNASNDGIKNGWTYEKVLEEFVKEFKNSYPELKVE